MEHPVCLNSAEVVCKLVPQLEQLGEHNGMGRC